MRFSARLIIIGLVFLPQLVFAATGSEVAASDGTIINFDPSQNFIGSSGQPLVDDQGSIKALTYLTASDDPATIAIRLINLALGFLGTISLIFMLYAGFVWFKARDNEEEVKRAKDILMGSVMGLTITLCAYGLAYLVFALTSRSTGTTII